MRKLFRRCVSPAARLLSPAQRKSKQEREREIERERERERMLLLAIQEFQARRVAASRAYVPPRCTREDRPSPSARWPGCAERDFSGKGESLGFALRCIHT